MFTEIFPENCRGHFLRVQNPANKPHCSALGEDRYHLLLAFSTNANSAELSMSAYSLSSQKRVPNTEPALRACCSFHSRTVVIPWMMTVL